MTILVTGSAGHLGEALMRTFRARGRAARGIDLLPSVFTDAVGSIADRPFVAAQMDGVRVVMHAATLHKPHVATHAPQDFVDTNVTGTLALLEAAVEARVEAFVFTSTTSTAGAALTPARGEPAAWITEEVVPIPKNVYGVTKVAAESVAELFHRQKKLPVIVLRTSRFFPEDDDDPAMRAAFTRDNAQANELLYRRVDVEDVVSAHLAAMDRARDIGFGRYVISATTPFTRADLADLRHDAPRVVARLFPEWSGLYEARGWRMFPEIDRVYDSARARADLGWQPKVDFAHVLACLRAGTDFRSDLARAIGEKGYHATGFAVGPYPIAT